MRYEGRLKSWNDDRGFGFIDPMQGGPEIFVHIKAFRHRNGRPHVDQFLSFEVELGPQGKNRAKNVELVGRTTTPRKRHRESSTPRGTHKLVAIPGFVVLYLVVSFFWEPPLVLAAIYLGVSVVTFIAYALDKSAARRDARRTPEGTLHMLALAGGWPGALLAQQSLRHKSSKTEFQTVFWCTVILNIIAFVLISSGIVERLWAPQ
jgi:uncharacterized membrane protein YsdA (DUF1294 family)/cold shock CspA family protein